MWEIVEELARDTDALRFGPPITHVYNPLVYARRPHKKYVTRYGRRPKQVLFVGMNPGPFGMAQTGIPFGEVRYARDWLEVADEVERPAREHPKRPVDGFECLRSEVSGARLWGWARDRFGTPEAFFERFYIANYCPLCFMEASGRNFTPDKLPVRVRERLLAVCDRALRRTVEFFKPEYVVGVGAFAAARARAVLTGLDVEIGRIPHPSPASPAANRDWAGQVDRALEGMRITLPKKAKLEIRK